MTDTQPLYPRPLRALATRATAALAACLMLLGAASASAQEVATAPEASMAGTGMQTIAVVAMNGYDDLMADINYLGGLFGRPESGQMIEGMVAMFTQGKGIVGLDKSRPLGVVVAADGENVTPVGCLPIDDLDAVLQIAQGFGLMPADAGGGVTELELPDQTLYLKPDGAWVFVADDPDALENTPADPSALLESLVSEYDLGAKALVQSIPEEARAELIGAMREGMEAGLQQQPGESDEQHEMRVQLAEVQVDQITDMIDGIDELTFGLNIDAEGKVTQIDGSVTTIPGTMIATALTSYDNLETHHRGFHREGAAMSMLAAGNNPPELIEQQREQLETLVGVFREQINQAIDEQDDIELTDEQRETLKEAGADLMDAYEALVFAERSDAGGSVDFKDGQLSVIAGVTLDKPEKLESALKSLVQVLDEQPGFPGVQWDADSHAGVAMHQLSVPLPPNAEKVRPMFGEMVDVTVGFGPGSAYIAAGPRGVEDLKEAIDQSASSVGPLEYPAEVLISVGKILRTVQPYATPDAEPMLNLLVDKLDEMPAGADEVSVRVIRIDQGATFRYQINEGVLQAIGAAAEAAQAAQAGGGF